MKLKPRRCKPPRDITGAIRYILVDEETGRPRFRTHYPSPEHARSCRMPGERVVKVRVTGRAGPFSDSVERLDGGAV